MGKYIIFGASGLVGSEIVKICEKNNLDYIGIYRKKLENINMNKSWIGNLEDFPYEYLNDAILLCCLGSSLKHAKTKENFIKIEVDLIVKLAEKAKLHNVKSFNIISAIYATLDSKIFYSKVKGILEQKILNINIKNLNIFRPSLLSGNRIEFRFWERFLLLLLKPFNFMFNLPFLLYFKVMPAELLARCMLHVASSYNGINILNNDEIHKLQNNLKNIL